MIQPTHSNRSVSSLSTLIFILLVTGGGLFVDVNTVQAQNFDLIVCGEDGDDANTTFDKAEECSWGHLVLLAQNLIKALVFISTLLAGAVMAYAGYVLLTSGGNTKAREDAKGMLWKVVIGYLWILGAWLLVYTISEALLFEGFSILGEPTSN